MPNVWQTDNDSGVMSRFVTRQVDEDIEALKQQAYEEGFAKGHEQGLQSGKDELAEYCGRLKEVLRHLSEPLEGLDQQMENELSELAVAIARQVIRREIKTDPHQIIAVVKEARSVLPASTRSVTIMLHPDDATIVRDILSDDQTQAVWQVQEDAAINRGGCKVVTEASYVDATIEGRVAKIAAKILGGDRAQDRQSADKHMENTNG